jgi:hypothetical protein
MLVRTGGNDAKAAGEQDASGAPLHAHVRELYRDLAGFFSGKLGGRETTCPAAIHHSNPPGADKSALHRSKV